MRLVIKRNWPIKAARRRRGRVSVFVRGGRLVPGKPAIISVVTAGPRPILKLRDWQPERPSDPARIRSPSKSPGEQLYSSFSRRFDSAFLSEFNRRGRPAKYLFARSTFEINSRCPCQMSVGHRYRELYVPRERFRFRLLVINGSRECERSVSSCEIFNDVYIYV